MSDIDAAVIVSYTKHWDNDTKGTMEFPAPTIARGVELAESQLTIDALDEGVDVDDIQQAFTITKATFGVPSNWLGV